MIETLFFKFVPYIIVFISALIMSLILTPLVREINRKMGLVDKPDPRRINKVPIPRGGGVALAISALLSYSVYILISGTTIICNPITKGEIGWKLIILSLGIVLLGYVDDKWSLSPKVKLLGQIIVAFLSWHWCDLGFSSVIPSLPIWFDCALTIFWFVGAINAFNLIDGIDGLASGIGLISTIGMTGTILLLGKGGTCILFNFAFVGALLGFLVYNYHPATVFLGDSGSMFIGYVVASLPLLLQTPGSFLVSVGVPILIIGVPIFDSLLAIIRRLVRRLINLREPQSAGNDRVMTADSDHLHHRILRAVGSSQKKAVWILYSITIVAVFISFALVSLQSRASGVWLLAFTLGCIVVFRNMKRIEFYDIGRLLNSVVHSQTHHTRRFIARFSVPIYVVFDVLILISVFFLLAEIFRFSGHYIILRATLLIRVFAVFSMFVLFGVYRTVWSRGHLSSYVRLALASLIGSFGSGIVIGFLYPNLSFLKIVSASIGYAIFVFLLCMAIRNARAIVRDFFYQLDCSRLRDRKDVSRILVYGAGLRYTTFRRELVRSTEKNDRIIVGIIDDDIFLRHQYIGNIKIEGTLQESPEIINRLNIDAVVICCVVTPEWMKVIKQTLAPTGVKISYFTLNETPISI